MNEEILKLAKECGAQCTMRTDSPIGYEFYDDAQIEAFYRAAYNKAIEDAVKRVAESDDKLMAEFHIERIRALEMK